MDYWELLIAHWRGEHEHVAQVLKALNVPGELDRLAQQEKEFDLLFFINVSLYHHLRRAEAQALLVFFEHLNTSLAKERVIRDPDCTVSWLSTLNIYLSDLDWEEHGCRVPSHEDLTAITHIRDQVQEWAAISPK